MPGRYLPTIPQADVAAHNTSKSCYVTIGTKVYDVTEFLPDHPGGGDLILDYGGKDVSKIMKDELSHSHSEAAYEVLDECFVGFVATEKVIDCAVQSDEPDKIVPLPAQTSAVKRCEESLRQVERAGLRESSLSCSETTPNSAPNPLFENTGMSSADDLSRETDAVADYKTHKFLDLKRPLLLQIWYGGFSKDFYLEQVHRPRHYKGGASAPLFGNFLEPLTKTAWWVIPAVWLPFVAYGTWIAGQKLGLVELVLYWITGSCIWTLVEYVLHRLLFHIETLLPDNRVGLTLHFLFHGIHHYLPMDRYRLVMPPTLFIVLATPFWYLSHTLFFYNWHAALAVFCGGVFGYVCYDLTHYFLHHKNLPYYYRELKKYHLKHHFADYQNGYGVTSRFWDRVFKTELEMPAPKVVKAS